MNTSDLLVEPLTWRENEILTLLSQNLTDPEIARRLVLSVHTVKWYTRRIYSKLGVANRKEAVTKARDLGLLVSETLSNKSSHNLPRQLSSFIGREKEIDQVVKMVGKHPLVTLTGPGGVGKSRLALKAAERLQPFFRDGAWLVELVSVTDPGLVPQSLARLFDIPERPDSNLTLALCTHLKQRCLLLVLDNCEHLLDACATLTKALLRSSPGLSILVTSRQRLGIQGETVFLVPPLTFPEEGQVLNAENADSFEAPLLFFDRAQNFIPNENELECVAQICRRLDGIPFAIELAASRTRILSVSQITSRLQNSLRLLTSGDLTEPTHHQTLRAMIDWSYDHLSPREQSLLQELSVFVGGWVLDAAEAVCSDTEILDSLDSLVNHSLVQVTRLPALRFGMLETVRQYAAEKLQISGHAAQTRAAHLTYFLDLAEKLEFETRTYNQKACLDILETELPNLRAALEWGLENAIEAELRLASALVWLWQLHSRHLEGIKWLDQGLEQITVQTIRPDIRANALETGGFLRMEIYKRDEAKKWLTESLQIYLRLGETYKQGKAKTLAALCCCELYFADYAQAAHYGGEARSLYQELDDPFYKGLCSHFLGAALWNMDANSEEARRLMTESLAIHQRLGDLDGMASANMWLGIFAIHERNIADSKTHFEKCLDLHQQVRNLDSVANTLNILGDVSKIAGDMSRAIEYYIAALKIGREQNSIRLISTNIEALADVYLRLGNYRLAQEYLYSEMMFVDQNADYWSAQWNDSLFEGERDLNLLRGILACEQKDIQAAIHWFNIECPFVERGSYPDSFVKTVKTSMLSNTIGETKARNILKKVIRCFSDCKRWTAVGRPLDGLARLEVCRFPERAARLFGAAESMDPCLINWLYPLEKSRRQSAISENQGIVGKERMSGLWSEGKAMAPEEVVVYALQDE